MDYKELGLKIKEYRRKMNLTQEKLAEAVELSTVYIGQIETGLRKPSLSTVVKVAHALCIPIEFLIRDSVELSDSATKNEMIKLLEGRSNKEIRLAIDTVRTVLGHIKDDTLA